MHVEKPARRGIEQLLRKDPSVRDHGRDVGLELSERRQKLLAADLCRLNERNSFSHCYDRDGRLVELHPSPGRAVRLRDDRDDPVTRRKQSLERGRSEFRSPEEGDAHEPDHSESRPEAIGQRSEQAKARRILAGPSAL